MRVVQRLFPDPDLCTRCGHYQGSHVSRLVYPGEWGQRVARPCTVVAPTGKGVRNCGCPEFVAAAPWFLRLLNALLGKVAKS